MGVGLQSFSIITTDANELMAPVHTRMPVIIHPRDYQRWLERDSERAPADLLRPFEAEAMAAALCNRPLGSNGTANRLKARKRFGNTFVLSNHAFGDARGGTYCEFRYEQLVR